MQHAGLLIPVATLMEITEIQERVVRGSLDTPLDNHVISTCSLLAEYLASRSLEGQASRVPSPEINWDASCSVLAKLFRRYPASCEMKYYARLKAFDSVYLSKYLPTVSPSGENIWERYASIMYMTARNLAHLGGDISFDENSSTFSVWRSLSDIQDLLSRLEQENKEKLLEARKAAKREEL